MKPNFASRDLQLTSKAAAAINVVKAIAEAVRELKEVPSGKLYASVMGVLSYQEYQWIIDRLKGAGLVTESANLLKWVEPKQEAA